MADALRCLTEARDEGAPWVARGDFSRCFDEIPRDRLLDRLAKVVPDAEPVDLIRALVHRPVEGGPQHGEKGLHQGSALSPVLTNLYLDQFDRAMLDDSWQVIRYGDDYAIPVADRVAGDAAVQAAQRAAADLGLALSPQKCSVRSFDEGVPFRLLACVRGWCRVRVSWLFVGVVGCAGRAGAC